jgi:hypothetical protein
MSDSETEPGAVDAPKLSLLRSKKPCKQPLYDGIGKNWAPCGVQPGKSVGTRFRCNLNIKCFLFFSVESARESYCMHYGGEYTRQ